MFIDIAIGLIAFLIGAVVGAANVSSVTAAIATIKSAEQKAQATLAQITIHKAS